MKRACRWRGFAHEVCFAHEAWLRHIFIYHRFIRK